MDAFNLSSILSIFLLLTLFQTCTIANKKPYIVYLGSHSHGLSASSLDHRRATVSHYDLLGSVLGSKMIAKEAILYSYNKHINGFAAMLDEKQAADLAKFPNVVSVFESQARKLHTTRSWKFLGIEKHEEIPSNYIWNVARFGDDIIIANFDTGVWPESKSFSDEGYGPIPSRWKGTCQSDPKFHCNRKLIGARFFNLGYGELSVTFNSSKDNVGHGTHTLSIAGGNFVSGANVLGMGNGTIKGGSPRARVASYKVCWPAEASECLDPNTLAAFEAAIDDGVDVISISVGAEPKEFFSDALSVGAFHAVERGIVVVCSAGNVGPTPGTVSNVSPWILTVGASTIDRDFTNFVVLGNKKKFKGTSFSSKALPFNKLYPLINAVDAKANNVSNSDAEVCEEGSLDPEKLTGKIVVCLRGGLPRVSKGYVAAKAGAAGMILVNDEESGNAILTDLHILPASHITYNDSISIFQYINSTKTPMAYISSVMTELEIKPSPVMADFSSRGPNTIEESILKPDITAPGVNIMAAYPNGVPLTKLPLDDRQAPFNVDSGTSMACPHVAGIVGLLKTLNPKWSPAAIKSAIMTTAKTRDNSLHPILDSTGLKATPLAYGAGHVNPNSAMDPGLVYDITIDDYLNFLCARGYNATQIKRISKKIFVCDRSFKVTDLNYPSISVTGLKTGHVTINRKVKNVGSPGTYVARVKAPLEVSIMVEPSTLHFTAIDEEKSFKVLLHSTGKGNQNGYVFGKLAWSDGKHHVRSQIVVNLGE
ncbi:subtilisin-like protease SBT5.4 [Benincasa hispida]|uniref:subtilisin-like protease SBT5.4 n=1 Tax=Benincasa hispida TaxID=102211 RepID=UPI0019014813|nr:subtilisin-like protease SBT5.4 [Benincasa hispida]